MNKFTQELRSWLNIICLISAVVCLCIGDSQMVMYYVILAAFIRVDQIYGLLTDADITDIYITETHATDDET